MYEIHFRRSFTNKGDYTTIAENIKTLAEAATLRQLSGDLVVYAATHKVVPDTAWLFEWELLDKDCYARKAIDYDNKKGFWSK